MKPSPEQLICAAESYILKTVHKLENSSSKLLFFIYNIYDTKWLSVILKTMPLLFSDIIAAKWLHSSTKTNSFAIAEANLVI